MKHRVKSPINHRPKSFDKLHPEVVRFISQKGGRVSGKSPIHHRWTKEEATALAMKGVHARQERKLGWYWTLTTRWKRDTGLCWPNGVFQGVITR